MAETYPSLVKSKLKIPPWHWCDVVSSGFHICTHWSSEYNWLATEPRCIRSAPCGNWPSDRWPSQLYRDDFGMMIDGDLKKTSQTVILLAAVTTAQLLLTSNIARYCTSPIVTFEWGVHVQYCTWRYCTNAIVTLEWGVPVPLFNTFFLNTLREYDHKSFIAAS